MADDDVALVVNGRRYSGWKSVRVTRSIESLAGSFALGVSDRWDGREDPWPIAEEDECRVEIGGRTVIDGYIDDRQLDASPSTRSLTYTGRDRAAALVDCSLLVEGATVAKNKWTYRNVDVAQFAAALAEPFGVPVSVQAGIALKKVARLVAHPGETAFEALKRATADAGVMAVSDGAGGILLTRAGTARAEALVEGVNVKACSVRYDGKDRFYRYVISSQVPGSDDGSGEDTRSMGEAVDHGVRRRERVLVIRPDKGYSVADARARADWEARSRAARAETVSVTVQGWRQASGDLWPLNAIVAVHLPRLGGGEGDLLISQIEHSIGDGGRVTQLTLVRPDALTPEPTAGVKTGPGGGWPELARGAR